MTYVSLDLESTLADISTPFKEEYENRHGTIPEQWTTWNFEDAEFDTGDFMKITGGLWKRSPEDIPVTEKGLMAKVSAIYNEVEKLDVVTGRQGHREQMEWWLDSVGVVYDDFVIANSQEAKQDLGYDVFIDDCPHHAKRLHDGQVLLLYDQPYNRNVSLPDDSHRIVSLHDTIDYL